MLAACNAWPRLRTELPLHWTPQEKSANPSQEVVIFGSEVMPAGYHSYQIRWQPYKPYGSRTNAFVRNDGIAARAEGQAVIKYFLQQALPWAPIVRKVTRIQHARRFKTFGSGITWSGSALNGRLPPRNMLVAEPLGIPDLFASKGGYTMHLGFHGSSHSNIDAIVANGFNTPTVWFADCSSYSRRHSTKHGRTPQHQMLVLWSRKERVKPKQTRTYQVSPKTVYPAYRVTYLD